MSEEETIRQAPSEVIATAGSYPRAVLDAPAPRETRVATATAGSRAVGDDGARGRSPQLWQTKLAGLISETRQMVVADHVLETAPALRFGLVSDACRLVQVAVGLLDRLEQLAEAAAAGEAPVEEAWARSTGTSMMPRAFEELANLSFMASAELRPCLKQLRNLSSEDEPFVQLAAVERAQTRLTRGLCAVEARLARMCGRPSKTRFVDLRRRSLEARRLIGKFRRRTTASRRASAAVEERLRSAGTSIAWLVGHQHFSDLRGSDRLVGRQLHVKILDWLRSRDSTEEEGRHLLQEIAAFTELLALINQRPELVEHDVEVLAELVESLASSDPEQLLPPAAAKRLDAVAGRDDSLDELRADAVELSRIMPRLLQVYAGLRREDARLPAPADVGSPLERRSSAADLEAGPAVPIGARRAG